MTNSWKTLTQICLYVATLTPLVLTSSLFFPFINGKAFLFRTSVTLAAVFFLVHLIVTKRTVSWSFWRHPIVLAAVVFGAVFVITGFLGIIPWNSFWSNFERGEGGYQMLHYTAYFLLTALAFRSRADWKRLLIFGVCVSFFVSGYGFFQWLRDLIGWDNFTINTGRTSGTLGNPSYFSAYLLFHFLFTVWILTQERIRNLKWLWIFILLAEIGLYFTTRTLAAILALIVTTIVLVVFYIVHAYRTHAITGNSRIFLYISYLGSFIIVLFIAGPLYFFSDVNLYQRLQPRLWTWGSAFQGVLEHPLLGWGAENFPHVFDKYYNVAHFGGESWFDRAHNVFLEYLIAGGIILLIAYLSMFAVYYWRLFLFRKSRHYQPWLWPLFFVLPITYFIQGLTLFEVLPIYLALFLFLAFFVHYEQGFENRSFLVPVTRHRALVAGGVGVVLVAVVSLYVGTYLPLRKNLHIAAALRTRSAQEAVDTAARTFAFWSPIGQQEAYESVGRNFVIYMQQLEREKALVEPSNPGFLRLMELNERTFEEIKPHLPGIKDYYLYALWNLSAARISRNPEYLNRAKPVIAEARALAPRRIELLLIGLDIARIEGNKAAEQEYIEQIRQLRPDILNLPQ